MQSLLFVGIIILNAAQPARTKYLGCFQYTFGPILDGKTTSSNSMTVEKCQYFCQWEDTFFYGIEDSSKCLCGDVVKPCSQRSDKECSAKCSGNDKELCGGKRKISIYKNLNYGKDYLGCFLDQPQQRTLNGKILWYHTVNVDRCKMFCEKQNAQYYGLEHRKTCICGDLTKINRRPEGECSDRCEGNLNQVCGGRWRLSLYRNRKYKSGYVGCYHYQSAPSLNGRNTSSDSMTVEKCKEFCQQEDVKFYGVEGSSKCFCGNDMKRGVSTSDKECSAKCSGNENQFCGGDKKISIYKNSHYEKGYLGCFMDQSHQRTLNGKILSYHTVNVDRCRMFCEKLNAQYYGLELRKTCVCGDLTKTSRRPEVECSDRCEGNLDQFCGGHWRLSLYRNRKYKSGYVGCYHYQAAPSLNGRNTSSDSMTVERCKEFCQQEDVKLYGVEGSNKCFCGNDLSPGVNTSDKECSAKCSGNEKQFCGGDRKISIYKNSHYEKGYLGCFLDQPQQRILNGKILWYHTVNVDRCKTFCEKQNAQYYGLEHRKTCICGDATQLIRKPEGECSDRCEGNLDQFCGGHRRISLYINRNYDNRYWGCFQYYIFPTLNGRNTSSTSMTVEKCKAFCQQEDVKFYGIEGSSKCFCGNGLLPSVKMPNKDCNAKCSGNEKQFCGGDRKISIYENSNYEKGYLGCFLDQPQQRTLNGKIFSHHSVNVDVCKKFCEKQNSRYYGLEHRKTCICGDVTQMIRKPEGECSDRCEGNLDHFCGGHWRISLYINRNYDNSRTSKRFLGSSSSELL